MSETPERIEREMFEIRSRMAPDMTDLRKHLEPKHVSEKVKLTLRQRLQALAVRAKTALATQGRQTVDSAGYQISLLQTAIRSRDFSQVTAAVKKDPKPSALLGVLLVLVVLSRRK